MTDMNNNVNGVPENNTTDDNIQNSTPTNENAVPTNPVPETAAPEETPQETTAQRTVPTLEIPEAPTFDFDAVEKAAQEATQQAAAQTQQATQNPQQTPPQYQPPQYNQPPQQQVYYTNQPQMTDIPPEGYQQKSRLAAALLAITVGCFGVHNFYLGNNTKAIIQLVITVVTCGFGAIATVIWAFVEGVQLLIGEGKNRYDGNGVIMKD